MFDRFLGQSKTTAGLHMSTPAVGDREGWQKVHRRLPVADCGQHAREGHFDRSLRPQVVVWWLLDVPLSAELILHRHAWIRSLFFSLHEHVGRVRVRRPLATPLPVKQIACRDVVRRLPELRHGHLFGRRSGLDLRGAEGLVQREQQRKHVRRRASHCRVLSRNEWNNAGPPRSRARSLERVGQLEEHPPSFRAVADVDAGDG